MTAQRVFYLLTLVALLAGTWVLPAVADEPGLSAGQAPAGGIQSLSGSMATFNPAAGGDICYAPGSTQTFCFLSESYTTDWEYAYDNFFGFPSDWQVVSAYDAGPDVCDYGGTWGTFGWYIGSGAWELDAYTPRYQANPTDHCYTNICVEVVTGTGGDVSWYWSGDGYGGAPHHPCSDDGYTPAGWAACDEAINPVAAIPPCAEGLYLSPGDQGGAIPPGDSDVFFLNLWNNTTVDEYADVYYAATGPGTCYGPATSPLILAGDTWVFDVTVEMDPGANVGDVVDCEVHAVGQNTGYEDYAYIHAEALFPGPPAYALDVYPGYNLVHWDDLEIPGAWTAVGSVPGFRPAGDFLGDNFDIMYALNYDTNAFSTIDTATGAETIIGYSTPTGSWTGMTGTADGSTLYAASSSCGTESYLYEVDPGTGALTLIGPMRAGSCMIDIAINADGDMYGVDIVDDSLYQIDTGTGAATYIGYTGASANYAQGMDFDNASGTLYWAAYTASGELRTLDLNTGASTLVGGFPGGAEVDCLAIPTVPGGAPCVFATHVRIIALPSPYLLGIVRVGTGPGTKVPGATVNVEWDLGGYYIVPQTRVTNANGLAFPVMVRNWPFTYYLNLISISAPGYDYCPGDNWEDHASWTP